jgi:GlpG protein
MQRVTSLESHLDLRPLIVALAQRGLHIQVTEESGRQVVWAMDAYQAEQVARVLADWQAGRLIVPEIDPATTRMATPGVKDLINRLLQAGWYAPVSMSAIALCLLVALVSGFGTNLEPVRWMFFPNIDFGTGNAFIGLLAGISGVMDVVRLFTPALLHFGIIHLVFNTLWLWHLGRMIEDTVPIWHYVGLILVTAFFGNVAQFLWSGGEPNFGGMSGVVYGLIGFIWMWQTFVPYTRLRLPPAMIGIFLLALVLMEVMASAFIATAAHAGGLVSGMVYGVAVAMLSANRREYQ